MRTVKIFTLIIAITSFIAGCNSTQTDDIASATPYPNEAPATQNETDDNYWARENLDLQAVGDILKESDSAEDFERRLNADDGVNNLDLNGDGYVDYISVSEFEDRDTGYRGFSLLDNFGGTDAIQELATIILDRTLNDGRGSRLYINGNDQIYGDGYNYQADWKDTTLSIVNWAFGDRNDIYESPYYYDNYPSYYETYRVVETPIYRTRIQQRFTEPIFVKASNDDYYEKIKIRSPYKDKYYDKIYAKIAKPNEAQKEFREKNPKRPEFIDDRGEKIKNRPPGLDKDKREKEKRSEKDDKGKKGDSDDFGAKPEQKGKDDKMKNKGRGQDRERGNGKDKDGGKGNGKGKSKGGDKGKD